jgi:hypothetical protein
MIRLIVDGESRMLEPEVLIVAGYTGADVAAVEHHIAELADEGVPPPPRVPMYWAMPPELLTQEPTIRMPGPRTSGEIELALVVDGDDVFVTAGSDHTDRAAETIDIGLSKLACPTPLATEAWRWSEIADHWPDLGLRSEIDERGATVVYQDDRAGVNRHPADLLSGIPWSTSPRPACFVLLCGTVGCRGGIRPSDGFRGSITDPLRDRTIELRYRVDVIPQLTTEIVVSETPE